VFSERFEGSAVRGANRQRLSFETRLATVNPIKDEWAFIWDDPLRYNVAYALQDVHFGILLVNEYNVYWTPEAMIFKHAIVQVDPRVHEVLGKEWVWIDSKEIPLPGVTLPVGQRAVTGLQRMVTKEQLDRNAKMQVLIRAARKTGIVDEAMAAEVDDLRKLRNRIHIKTLEGPECTYYTSKMANDALDLLERFREAALRWTVDHRTQDAASMSNILHAQATQTLVPAESVEIEPADFGSADDDIRF
jgi:hypothetical protein